jgi:hypothetical protein
MLTSTQRDTFRAWRNRFPKGSASAILGHVRAGKPVPRTRPDSSGYRGLNGRSVIQYWDDKSAVPFRFVGYADELIRSIGHTGWYSDAHQDSTLRGMVYRLPARDGRDRYLSGYEESDSGCVVLYLDIQADESDAARFADRVAERLAEDSREYAEAWEAGQDASNEVNDALQGLRHEVSRIVQIALFPDRAGLTLADDASADRQYQEARDKLESVIRAARDSRPTYSAGLRSAWSEGFDGPLTIKAIGGGIAI